MGFTEFFKHISDQKRNEARGLRGHLSDLYLEASTQIKGESSDINAINAQIEETSSALNSQLEIASSITDEFLPFVIGEYQKRYGEGEPPADVLLSAAKALRKRIGKEVQTDDAVGNNQEDNTPSATVSTQALPEVVRRKRKEKTESDPNWEKLVTFSDRQVNAIRATFRLVDKQEDGLRIDQTLGEIYPADELNSKNLSLMMANVRGNFDSGLVKLQRIFKWLGGENCTVPISEDALIRLKDESTLDVFLRINATPAYQGLTLQEVVEYTKTLKGIDLVGDRVGPVVFTQTEELPENVLIESSESLSQSLRDTEVWFLGTRILKTGWLEGNDRRSIENEINRLESKQIHLSLAETRDINQVKSVLYDRLKRFLHGAPDEAEEIFDSQSEVVQIMLGAVQRYWLDQDLKVKLDIKP